MRFASIGRGLLRVGIGLVVLIVTVSVCVIFALGTETGTRWTLAGRAIDGPLRGQELTWVDSIQCRWYAWSTEYPETLLHESSH